jgi:serine/threonine-protein kinase LATS1/2
MTTFYVLVPVEPKEHRTSPKPERKQVGKESNRKSLIKNCPPEAFKFFMEQHIENVMKEYEQRRRRRLT